MKSEAILGIPVHAVTLDEAVQTALGFLNGKTYPRIIHTANANVLTLAQKDSLLRQSFVTADLLLPDGQGAVLGSKLFGKGMISHKVAGPDFFDVLNAALGAQQKPFKVFFLGSTPKTLEKITRKMRARCPHIRVTTYSPPFKPVFSDEDNKRMLAAINNVRPDVLWVGMTAPKQEHWVEQHKHLIKAKLVATVGAAFDYFAGNVRRMPRWMQSVMGNTEFIYRFALNPQKMFRRAARSAIAYPFLLLKKRFFRD